MNNIETIQEFYKRKFDWMPDNILNEIGHFNTIYLCLVINTNDYEDKNAETQTRE